MKSNLDKLACFAKYKSYTATNNIPTALRGKELLQYAVTKMIVVQSLGVGHI